MFNNLSIQKKLWLNGIVAVVVFMIIAAFTAIQNKEITDKLYVLFDVNYQMTSGLSGMYAQGLQSGQSTSNILLNPKDTKAAENHQNAMNDFEAAYTRTLQASPEADRRMLKKIKSAMNDDWSLQSKTIDLAISGKTEEAMDVLSKTETPKWLDTKALILKQLSEKQDETYKIKEGIKNTVRTNSIIINGLLLTGIGLYAVILYFLIIRSFVGPVNKIVRLTEALSNGDFTVKFDTNQNDEIGRLSSFLNRLALKLGTMIREINNGVITLNLSSIQLSDISDQISQGAEHTSGQSNTVAAAAEEMSVNMSNVAAASEQASNNVSIVASAVVEMNTTVREIALNSEKARVITSDAVAQIQAANSKVDELGVAAREISNVTEVITEISEQTNLLALNATIEAARAGEAGKGFAVVANEIKELAKQTAQATLEIKKRIEEIQSSTSDSVDKIKQISDVVVGVNEIVATIAAAVEEQSVTTQEIANNVSQVSDGIQEVNTNVAQSSSVTIDISKEISGINISADETAKSSSEMNVSAHDLKTLAGRLTKVVTQFKITPARFDIGLAKSAHLKWRMRLEGLLHGRQSLKPEEVASHHECDFGKWYDSPDGQKLKETPVFGVVGKHHEKVHAHARQIVELFQQKEGQKAASLMASFEEERERLFVALDDLYLS